jgi:hypothetical protein
MCPTTGAADLADWRHDCVEFAAPFGILGRLVEVLVLRRYLQRLITNRGRFLAGLGV